MVWQLECCFGGLQFRLPFQSHRGPCTLRVQREALP
jgi:hypothetical protein